MEGYSLCIFKIGKGHFFFFFAAESFWDFMIKVIRILGHLICKLEIIMMMLQLIRQGCMIFVLVMHDWEVGALSQTPARSGRLPGYGIPCD